MKTRKTLFINILSVLLLIFVSGCTMFVPFTKKGVILINCENGYLKSEIVEEEGKEIVKITAVPDENYNCERIGIYTKNGNSAEDFVADFKQISDTEVSFSLRGIDIYVSAIFLLGVPTVPQWKIYSEVNDQDYCALNVIKESAPAGETVKITSYCRKKEMKVSDGYPYACTEDGTEIELTQNPADTQEYSFTMPEADVYIESKIEWIYYDITKVPTTNGTISIKSEAHEGEKVVFKLVPNSGKTVNADSVIVFDYSFPPELITLTRSTTNANEYSFVMPGYKVKVFAEFQ